jgi:hypothetical protein
VLSGDSVAVAACGDVASELSVTPSLKGRVCIALSSLVELAVAFGAGPMSPKRETTIVKVTPTIIKRTMLFRIMDLLYNTVDHNLP